MRFSFASCVCKFSLLYQAHIFTVNCAYFCCCWFFCVLVIVVVPHLCVRISSCVLSVTCKFSDLTIYAFFRVEPSRERGARDGGTNEPMNEIIIAIWSEREKWKCEIKMWLKKFACEYDCVRNGWEQLRERQKYFWHSKECKKMKKNHMKLNKERKQM